MHNRTADYTNGKDKKTVTFRPFRAGEDAQILACLRDEYGETYDARAYYDVPELFTRQSETGQMEITVVELANGKVIGFLIMKHQAYFPNQVEMSTMVIRKEYRNYHISGSLIAYCCAMLGQENIGAYFGHAQVFHTRSIAKLYEQGLMPCGYMLSMFIADTLVHSFGRAKAVKLPWAVVLKAVTKQDARCLYVPECHLEITRRIYDGLKVNYRTAVKRNLPVQVQSVMRPSMYEQQNTLWLMVDRVGEDLCALVLQEIARQDPRLLTVSLWLNVNDPAAVWAFEKLSAMGFFFTGYQPLAKGAEYMILHLPLNVPVIFDDFVPFEPIQYILDYVKEEYKRAVNVIREDVHA